jgi:translation initiation factor 4E
MQPSGQIPTLVPDAALAEAQGKAPGERPERHFLATCWTFHYLIPNRIDRRDANWKDFLLPLHKFQNLEDFWAILNTIDAASRLPKGCRYYIFREDIQPLWEDPRNIDGRELFVEFPNPAEGTRGKRPRTDPADCEAEERWKDLALSVLGNAPEIRHPEKINGVEYNCRGKIIKVGVWLAPTTEQEFAETELGVRAALRRTEPLKSNLIKLEPEGPASPTGK